MCIVSAAPECHHSDDAHMWTLVQGDTSVWCTLYTGHWTPSPRGHGSPLRCSGDKLTFYKNYDAFVSNDLLQGVQKIPASLKICASYYSSRVAKLVCVM